MRRIQLIILGLALGLAGGSPAANSCTGILTVNSLNFNSGYVIQLLNNPNNFNPNAALNILTAQVTNNTPCPGSAWNVELTLTEPANPDGCPGAAIMTPIWLLVNKTLQPGQSATLTAPDFGTGTNGPPTICQAFQTEMQNQFQNINSNNAASAVTKFLQRRFQVTLGSANVAVGPVASSASVFITIFNPPSQNSASPARLILPADQAVVKDALPFFVWTPAVVPGTTQGIDYTLMISQSNGGTPLRNGGTIAHLPTGQTFYKWQASDAQLPVGKVWWSVQASDHASGGLLGKPSAWQFFDYEPVGQVGANNCGYTLSDLDQYARRSASDKAKLLDGLTLQRVQVLDASGAPEPGTGLNDPDICSLLGQAGGSGAGQVKLLNLTVTRR